jgi:hypothetical protein
MPDTLRSHPIFPLSLFTDTERRSEEESNVIESVGILMALSMPAAALTTVVFFVSFMAAAPAGFRYKDGKTTAGCDQQDPDDQ